jgi:hypothetical protein
MGHRLFAKSDVGFLDPREVVNRIKAVFAYVEASEEEGQAHVVSVINQLQAMMKDGTIPHDRQYLAHLNRVRGRSIFVYFGDNPGVEEECLSTAVIPGEPLFFDYASEEHQKTARPILERCAIVLGYDIVEA